MADETSYPFGFPKGTVYDSRIEDIAEQIYRSRNEADLERINRFIEGVIIDVEESSPRMLNEEQKREYCTALHKMQTGLELHRFLDRETGNPIKDRKNTYKQPDEEMFGQVMDRVDALGLDPVQYAMDCYSEYGIPKRENMENVMSELKQKKKGEKEFTKLSVCLATIAEVDEAFADNKHLLDESLSKDQALANMRGLAERLREAGVPAEQRNFYIIVLLRKAGMIDNFNKARMALENQAGGR